MSCGGVWAPTIDACGTKCGPQPGRGGGPRGTRILLGQCLGARSWVEATRLASGCCGLAGNFGFTKGHGEVSEACAEQVLLPRVREADEHTVVLADGFSCRTQVHEPDSGGREAVHLAELVRGAGSRGPAGPMPERTLARRTPPPGTAERTAVVAGGAALTLVLGRWAARALGQRPSAQRPGPARPHPDRRRASGTGARSLRGPGPEACPERTSTVTSHDSSVHQQPFVAPDARG